MQNLFIHTFEDRESRLIIQQFGIIVVSLLAFTEASHCVAHGKGNNNIISGLAISTAVLSIRFHLPDLI